MKFLIVEDESLYADQLQMIVEQCGYEVCGLTDHAEEALKIFESQAPDIAIIDINLAGQMNGLELGKWLKRFKPNMLIIFITSLQEEKYFEGAKEISAFSFLNKPIDQQVLQRTIKLASQFLISNNKQENGEDNILKDLLVKNRSKYIKVKQKEITYISAEDKYCSIHLDNGKSYIERITLKDLNQKLSPDIFAQSHRSYIVNLDKVEETDTSDYTIKIKENHIPLGETYKTYFLKKIGI
ncbi:LytR/AlgR family response regulator transcription factor [Psychroflexus aestuariivivens]|uniref:LytR/AlgR family response regulator transcription factor n=1 Tax=Psychroflexus aestuariivivens TaxID=1795040 RepID=UPI000FD98F1E|nr:LytTR family DNA-binding domain-containing protein [Psychroflexus aestuariivivens]